MRIFHTIFSLENMYYEYPKCRCINVRTHIAGVCISISEDVTAYIRSKWKCLPFEDAFMSKNKGFFNDIELKHLIIYLDMLDLRDRF